MANKYSLVLNGTNVEELQSDDTLVNGSGNPFVAYDGSNDVTFTNDITVTTDASIGNDLTVTTDASIGNDLTVTANASIGSDLTVNQVTETVTTKSASFTPNLSTEGTIFSCSGSMTITMPTAEAGKSFTIIHSSGSSITWSGTILWNGGSAPDSAAAKEIYVFLSDGTSWYGNQAGTGYA